MNCISIHCVPDLIPWLLWPLCTSLYFVPRKEADRENENKREEDTETEIKRKERREGWREGGKEGCKVKCWSQYHRVNISAGGRG